MRRRDDLEGAVLDGRYEVGERLGRGGSAAVHRAWDRERAREVAVKVLPPGRTAEDARRGRRESDILGALDHPHLVALHDVLATEDATVLVMELVDGPSLHDRLLDGPLPADEVALVLQQVASGLAHAHRRGVVHRDVKPGNVLLRLEDGRVATAKLSDFGIARLADATRTTAEQTVIGTVRFLSPEQARGERVTAAADVYALGLTALAALTGEDAFPGSATETLAARIMRAPMIPAGLPADWTDLLRAMTALDPDDRLDAAAVASLAAELGTRGRWRPAAVPWADTGPETRPLDAVRAATVTRPPRRRSGRVAAALVGTAATGALLGGAIAALLTPTSLERAASDATPVPAAAQPSAAATTAPPAASGAAATPTSAPESQRSTTVTVADDHGGDRTERVATKRSSSSGGSSSGSSSSSVQRHAPAPAAKAPAPAAAAPGRSGEAPGHQKEASGKAHGKGQGGGNGKGKG